MTFLAGLALLTLAWLLGFLSGRRSERGKAIRQGYFAGYADACRVSAQIDRVFYGQLESTRPQDRN